MKKIYLILFVIISNSLITSCTKQNLEDELNTPHKDFASNGDDDPSDPPEEPIGE
ncbi:hypothetical protein [Christiangramia fulva]|uniref:hypothetical protein n=1 Tax=Christiangramia fulva TaxID=2126553 RepID=UPI00131CE779|nr:hypothetical protein [Christiangramia fulva]